MLKKILIFCSLLISIAGCTTRPLPLENRLPPLPIDIKVGSFQFTTLDEVGWHATDKDPYHTILGVYSDNNAYHISLARYSDSNIDESYVIQAWELKLPLFKNEEAFLRYFIDSAEEDTDAIRFKIIDSNILLVEKNGYQCVKLNQLLKDLKAKRRSRSRKPMLLSVFGITCINPTDSTNIAHIVFSNRYYEGNEDNLLQEKGQLLFDSLVFK